MKTAWVQETRPVEPHWRHMRLFRHPIMAAAMVPAFLILTGGPTSAGQSLIPTPYPGTVGGDGAVLDPEPSHIGGPQRLTRDPYPQILGETAQGNPPISRHSRHHQHLTPSINQRKYRVDHGAAVD